MPMYEYDCNKCNERFEFLQRSNEKATCPKCGSTASTKIFSVFAQGGSSNLPSCEGSVPTCAPSKCGSGMCGMNMG
ncbi:MAG: FmdB family zinc ribbon protein [Candidatus Anammoxibacter sp.]